MWAHTSYKWSSNPYKWPYKWAAGLIAPNNWSYNPTYNWFFGAHLVREICVNFHLRRQLRIGILHIHCTRHFQYFKSWKISSVLLGLSQCFWLVATQIFFYVHPDPWGFMIQFRLVHIFQMGSFNHQLVVFSILFQNFVVKVEIW